MNFKPLRATLVFLFAASLVVCSGASNMMPVAPTASTASIAQSGGRDIHSQCVPGSVSGGLVTIVCLPATGGDGLGGGFAGGGGAGAGNCNGGGLARLTIANPCTGVAPGLLGLLKWAKGLHCHDSISTVGENVPPNTSDYGHSVHDIYLVSSGSQPIGGSFGSGEMAYIYVDNNGQWFTQESPSYRGNALQLLSGSIPFIGDFLKAINDNGANFAFPTTAKDIQALKDAGNGGQKVGVQPCFSQVPSSVS